MMDEVLKRKLNILIHLAKVDGKFHKAEKTLLMDFVKDHHLDPEEFKMLVRKPESTEVDKITDKAEMLFLALKVIHADNFLDKKEIAYCKELATKLGFNKAIIDEFITAKPTREALEQAILKWH